MLSTGGSPFGVAVTPDGGYGFAAVPGGGTGGSVLRLIDVRRAPASIVPALRPMPQPGLPRGAYRSPKNLRTRADLRARTRRSGSENAT